MAENYGSLEGVLDANETLEGEIDSHDEMSGEIQFSGGVGGVKDVQVNNESVVDANKVAHIDLTPYAEKEDVYDKQTIDTALEGKADTDDIPTALSQLDNDDNYVQDADYVHTDNNFTDEDKAAIGGIPENITDLSDVEVSNIQNGQVLKWDATQEKFVNANESGGSGDVTDVKVNDTSVVDAQGVANIDLTGYAEKSDLGTASALDVAVSGDASTSQVVKGDDTRLTDARPASDVSSWAKASTKPDYTASEVGAIATTAKGTANGVAELDENGKVPSAQLPSYVDDVLEYASVSVFPATGESGKIYIALDTNKTYRWSGTTYTEISESLALGETDSTAYAGNKGKQNADNIAAIQGLIPSTATTSNKLATASDIPDISGKADKSEMSISTSGDQTTIQLKNGTSATVLNAHQSITGKADKVTNATENNFAALDANGNLKDSGHKHSDYLTQHQDISGKADKVSSATNGNLAGLNASGNLTDSGWNGAKDTTSISGNPISISGLKSNQLASNPIITLEPIQAGSGTPSPSNIRVISGYDKIEVLSCGVNVWNEEWEVGTYDETTGEKSSAIQAFRSKNKIRVIPNGQYYFNITSLPVSATRYPRIFKYAANGDYLGVYNLTSPTLNIASDTAYITFRLDTNYGTTYKNDISINYPATQTSYVASNKTTSISESLGQTVYWGRLNVRTGEFEVLGGGVDLGDLTYTYNAGGTGEFGAPLPLSKQVSTASNPNAVCSIYAVRESGYRNANNFTIGVADKSYSTSPYITIKDNRYNSASDLKTALTGQKLVYELATPFTIQLTPCEIILLSTYAYLSTNGTNIALDYHNGELASLSDVAQVGETVENQNNHLKSIIGSLVAWTNESAQILASATKTFDMTNYSFGILTLRDSSGGNGAVLLSRRAINTNIDIITLVSLPNASVSASGTTVTLTKNSGYNGEWRLLRTP